MEILNNWISGINDLLWSYVLIIMLLGWRLLGSIFKTQFRPVSYVPGDDTRAWRLRQQSP